MTDEPERIRREIERTRVELSSGVDALAYKSNPRRMATDQVDRVRGRVGGRLARIKDRVMGTATHARDATAHRALTLGHQASGAAHHSADSVTDAAHRISDTASHAASEAADRARHMPRMTRERTEGSPLAAGLIAFGAGILASAIFPPTGREQRLAGWANQKAMEHSGGVQQQLGAMAGQMKGNLREPAQHAVESVRSKTTEGASTVRGQGMAAAQRVQDQARQSGDGHHS